VKAVDFKSAISNVLSGEGCSAEFYFLLRGKEGSILKFVDINEEDQESLSNMFIDSIKDKILKNDDLALIEISNADDRTNAIYRYDLDEVPLELLCLNDILSNDDFERFDFGKDELGKVVGILILVGNQNEQLVLYKYQYPVMLIKQDRGFSLIKSRDANRFEKISEDILKINSNFDFLHIKSEYYVLNLYPLERFSGFQHAIKNDAEKSIEIIDKVDIVEDISVLSDRLDDMSFARKLVRSTKKSPVLGVVPNNIIVSFSNSHPALRGKFKYNIDRTKINLATKKSQNLFLKILNDDYLQSELTKLFYDSSAKDSVDISIN
jgi:hypothetical protein